MNNIFINETERKKHLKVFLECLFSQTVAILDHFNYVYLTRDEINDLMTIITDQQ
jgi:hypothetical protein